jgi:ubiquinone/menaquinone biosynthesis C-methylase UbiE
VGFTKIFYIGKSVARSSGLSAWKKVRLALRDCGHSPTDMPEQTRLKYSDAAWKSHIEKEAKYDERRFGKSSAGQRKNRREQAMVRNFLQSLPPNQLILDMPAGIGRFTELIVQLGHRPISADLNFTRSFDARNRIGSPIPAMQADIMVLPFKDNSIDAVICFRLLHHLPAEQILRALCELRRVANRAFATFYCTASVKFWKKSMRGKTVSGQYYPARAIASLSTEANWKTCRHNEPFNFVHQLHSVELSR